MDKPVNRLPELKQHVAEPAWDDARSRAVLERVRRSRDQARRVRRMGLMALVPATVALALWIGHARPDVFFQRQTPGPAVRDDVTVATPASDPLILHDGSRAERIGRQSRLTLLEDTPQAGRFELRAGAGRFEVVPNKSRRFQVHAGIVTVEALGTVFTVARGREGAAAEGRVHVAVIVGHVAVRWAGGETVLWQGNEGDYPPDTESDQSVEDEGAPAEAPAKPQRAARVADDWRTLARHNAFERAFDAMEARGNTAVRDIPQELMLASDVARRTGHLDAAARYLSRVLSAHGKDPRASVAAFTLGRVQAQAGRPAAAAAAFQRAYELDPRGALAEDALARAAESWRAAGDSVRAQASTVKYREAFPRGRQLAPQGGVLPSN